MESVRYAYFIATLPALAIWLYFYVKREDLRREMLVISALIGLLSIVTSYYWWTADWWRPLTITGTKVGIEDFLLGFGYGGIMAVVYAVFTGRRYGRRRAITHGLHDFYLILFLLAQTTTWLFYGVGLTSFYASTFAMLLVTAVMLFMRKDLMFNAIMSGLFVAAISTLFYATASLVSGEWADKTYMLDTLSGIHVVGIPVEEFIFWFLAGMVFGPFYEFYKGLRLSKA